MTRIECNCTTCQTNAARMGMSAPLAALIPSAAIGQARTAKGRHGLVYSANDPSVVGQAVRRATGIEATR